MNQAPLPDHSNFPLRMVLARTQFLEAQRRLQEAKPLQEQIAEPPAGTFERLQLSLRRCWIACATSTVVTVGGVAASVVLATTAVPSLPAAALALGSTLGGAVASSGSALLAGRKRDAIVELKEAKAKSHTVAQENHDRMSRHIEAETALTRWEQVAIDYGRAAGQEGVDWTEDRLHHVTQQLVLQSLPPREQTTLPSPHRHLDVTRTATPHVGWELP